MSANQETAVAIRMQDLSPAYAEIMVLGNVLQKSGYFRDVRDQAQAVTKILFGRELGFSPIVSMGGIHIIEGKPALSSNLMATLIKRSGKYDYRVKSWTHQECVLTFREKIDGKWEDIGESSFTMEDAKTAGVVKPSGSWAKYPRPMMFARALSQGLRTYCPDVSAAPVYSPEEMGAEVTEEGDVTQLPKSARPVERTTEDIPIAPLRRETDQQSADIVEASVKTGRIEPLPPLEELVESAKIGSSGNQPAAAQNSLAASSKGQPEPPKTPDIQSEYIDADDAKAIYMHVKKFLPKDKQKDAIVRGLVHDWCKVRGLVDVKGDGTLLKVKRVYVTDGKEVSGVTRTRNALETYFLDLLAVESESK